MSKNENGKGNGRKWPRLVEPPSTATEKHPAPSASAGQEVQSPPAAPDLANYTEGRLDLARHLIKNPAATFYVRVSNDSAYGLDIKADDLLIVDNSLEPVAGSAVIAKIDDGLRVLPHPLPPAQESECWGVISYTIRSLHPPRTTKPRQRQHKRKGSKV